MYLFRKFIFVLLILPFSICGQWTHGYATGQGNGYGTSSRHGTFDGYIKGDSLITFGGQVVGSKFSPDYEYFQDSYSLNDGGFGMSKIIYQWDGAVTSSRKLQSFSRYANGYIVNKSGHGETSAIRYIRNLNGSLIRIDSAQRTLIRTNQLIDTTHSFLCFGQGLDLFFLVHDKNIIH